MKFNFFFFFKKILFFCCTAHSRPNIKKTPHKARVIKPIYLVRHFKPAVNISAAVHNADNRNREVIMRGNIENKVVVHGHDTQITLTQVLFVIVQDEIRV